MGHAFKLFHKRNSRGWQLEGKEKKGFRGKEAGRGRVLIVRIIRLEKPASLAPGWAAPVLLIRRSSPLISPTVQQIDLLYLGIEPG
jgi:hypothetical protein